MRNVWRIFRDDMRLASSSLVALLVVLGLCLAPAMFAWLNIVGSWNPSGNTANLKVAIANCDEGYESDLIPVRVNVGDRVIEELHGNESYSWIYVEQEQAVEGVRSGEYCAAIVIPADFSQKMLTVFSTDAEKAAIEYYVNMKENPVPLALATEGGGELLEDVRQQFTEAVDTMALDLADDLISFIDSDKMDNYGAQLATRLGSVADSLDATAEQARLFAGLADAGSSLTSASTNALLGTSDATDASENVVASTTEKLDEAVESARSAAASIQEQVNASKSQLGVDGVGDEAATQLASDVSSLAASVSSIESEATELSESLKETVQSLSGSTNSLVSDLNAVRNALNLSANQLAASSSKVRKFQEDIASAFSRGGTSRIAGIIGSNSASLAQWIASPMQIEEHTVYPIANYGSSKASVYTLIALWVGALALVFVMKTNISQERARRYEEQCGRPLRASELYFGRYLLFAAIALVQATVLFLGNVFILQVQCTQPLLYLVACWVCALVFSNIAYTLALSFGGMGKALGLVMLAVQLIGLGGEYPVQMLGGFFKEVSLIFPFTYGMQAMQATIGGLYGSEYLVGLLLVLAFLVPSLLLGLAIRRPVIRFREYFNRKLESTGLMGR